MAETRHPVTGDNCAPGLVILSARGQVSLPIYLTIGEWDDQRTMGTTS